MAKVVGTVKEASGNVAVTKEDGTIKVLQAGDVIEENDVVQTLSAEASLVLELDGGRVLTLGGDEEVLIDHSVFAAVEEGTSIDVEALQAALAEGGDPSDLGETAAGEETPGDPAQMDVPYEVRGDARGNVDVSLRPTAFGAAAIASELQDNEDFNEPPVAAPDAAELDEDSTVTINVLANDSDPDYGDTLSVVGITQPAHGVVAINEDGSVTYTPVANYNGPDSFTYTVSDADGETDTALVSVTVNPVNDVPVAVDDVASLDEDSSTVIDVLANDSDIDGDVLSVAAVTQPAHGVAVVNADGTVTYTPVANYNGADSFTYTVTDPDGATDTALVSVTVNPLNDAPVAVDDVAALDEDSSTVIEVLDNDSDIDGDVLIVTAVTQPTHGVAVVNADGTVTYTPVADYNGPDSFTYTISDGAGGTDTATVSLTVNPLNDAPVAIDDTAATDEDVALVIAAADLLANDSDIDGDTLTITSFTQPAHGSVVDNGDGTFTYTPDANYNGDDSFTYTVSDGNGASDSATVDITVAPVNDAPEALDDAGVTTAVTYSSTWNYDLNAGNDYTNEHVTITPINGLSVDGSGPTMGVDGYPTNDSSQMVNPGEGITFVFDATIKLAHIDFGNFGKWDTAEWVIKNGDTIIDSGTYTNSGNPNDSILVLDYATEFDTIEIYNPVPADPDAQEYAFSVDQVLASNHGTDSFTVGSPLYFTVDDLIANDSDLDGDTLSITGVSDSESGSFASSITLASGAVVSVDDEGNILYDPSGVTSWDGDAPTTDSFAYELSDGSGGTTTATVDVDISHMAGGTYDGDTLYVDDYLASGDTQSVDFDNLAAMASDITHIDLRTGDAGKYLQTLSPENVRGVLGDSYDILHIDGDAGDTVALDGFTYDADMSAGLEGYNAYTGSFGGEEVILHIDTDIDVEGAIIP